MTARTALVTGGTGGIGRRTAMALAEQGFAVYVGGRDGESGRTVVDEIRRVTGNDDIHLLLGDLSTRTGVSAVAAQYLDKQSSLDVLVNNAGLAAAERRLTVDGLESDAAVNVMAPFLLTTLLWDALSAAPSARVVNLTGGSHPRAVDESNLQAELAFAGLTTYSHAKLVMMAVMCDYAQRTAETSVSVNVCYPGRARTAMTGAVTPGMLPTVMRPLWPVFKLLTRPDDGPSAAKASRSSVYLATSPDVQGLTGIYVDKHSRTVPWPAPVLDAGLRKRLFAVAEQWAGVSGPAGKA